DPGAGHAGGDHRRAQQPCGRHALCLARPAHSLEIRAATMTDIAPTPGAAVFSDEYVAPRGVWNATKRFLRRQPVRTSGIVLVAIFGLAGLFANVIAPYDPTSNDFTAMTEAPSWAHWLGTDQLGRDILSRILFGARTAFVVGITSAVVGGASGLVLGVGS